MHCPRCGHQQNSDEIRFCTKCGLEISDVKELLVPGRRQIKAKRKNEINNARRQGMMMVFSGFAVILVLAVLRDFFPVPKALFAISVLIFIIGGAVRMSMPSFFGRNDLTKSNADSPEADLETDKLTGGRSSDKSLPEAEYRPPLDFGARDYDTAKIAAPPSVTEETTKSLKEELLPQ